MPVSRQTSNGPDWQDVTTAAIHFAADWDGIVTMELKPYGTDRSPKLTITAKLWEDSVAIGVADCLASASVSMPGRAAGDLSAGLLLALYELDKEMYRRATGVSPIRR